jgi:hypothetical protein
MGTEMQALLAPKGRLRAAINFGNTVLARRGATLAEAGGTSVEIARELARRLDVPVELLAYETAGEVVADAKNDVWDVGFMAIDPKRAGDVQFTPPYVLIEGGYRRAQRLRSLSLTRDPPCADLPRADEHRRHRAVSPREL